MLRSRVTLAVLICCALLTPAAPAASKKPSGSLKKQIEAIVSQPDLARGFLGVQVVSVRSGKPIFSLNAEKMFTPASNTKLFTTAAALALIGSEYKFRTTLETNGSLDKYGRLTGDLVLVGRGDPSLSGREMPYNMRTQRDADPMKVFEKLADELVQKGVKYIDGDIIADDSYFAFERYGEGWSQDDLVWPDGAPVSALTINDNVIFVQILPGARAGDKAFVSVTPFADYYTLDNRLLTTPAYRLAGQTTYALEGSIFVAGAAVKWLRDGLGVIADAAQTHSLATQVPDSHGVIMVPAFVGLGAPHWDPDARGAIFGLTLDATGAHLARAALESVAFQTLDLIDAVAKDFGSAVEAVRIDGGMAANAWLGQFLADILQVPVERPQNLETTALGAAFLAGLATGVWDDLPALERTWKQRDAFKPAMPLDRRERLIAGWRDAVARMLSKL